MTAILPNTFFKDLEAEQVPHQMGVAYKDVTDFSHADIDIAFAKRKLHNLQIQKNEIVRHEQTLCKIIDFTTKQAIG